MCSPGLVESIEHVLDLSDSIFALVACLLPGWFCNDAVEAEERLEEFFAETDVFFVIGRREEEGLETGLEGGADRGEL